jgi:hypothetical protein
MPILVHELSVWDIGFRMAGLDPRKFYFRIPLQVEDHFRNLINAIHKGELFCWTISLEKREYEKDEEQHSIYYWIEDFFACEGGGHINRKLMRWAHVERFDFMLWCERMNIPLPEFWFPPGWNLSYELPEGDLYPGYGFELQYWQPEARKAYEEALEVRRQEGSTQDSPTATALEKIRPNQEARIACQQIAKGIWRKEPDRTIASVVRDELIQEFGGARPYEDETVREWIKVVAPQHVRDRRGAPRKNGGKDIKPPSQETP